MSAWYVLSAIGLFPPAPCSDEYALAPPLFDRVTLNLESGDVFKILVRGRPATGDAFITSATLDGQPLTRSYLRHAEIASGGELVLDLGDSPGESWGQAPEDRPRTGVEGDRVPAAPFLISATDSFRESLTFELRSADPAAVIRYTFDPQVAPDQAGKWQTYAEPLTATASTRVRFFSEHAGVRGPVVESYLHHIDNDWRVQLHSRPHPQYTAGGPEALVDGLPGDANWRTGGWVGVQHDDLEVTVDLRKSRSVRRIGASFLQEQRAWIWMPAEVVFSISDDGESFREVGRRTHDVAEDADGVELRELSARLSRPVTARYVKIEARNFGVCPDWHPGAGGGAYIFIDEVRVE